MQVQPPPNRNTPADIRRGSVWTTVGGPHQGQNLVIRRDLSDRNRSVLCRPTGGSYSRAQKNNQYAVPLDAFLARHRLTRAAK